MPTVVVYTYDNPQCDAPDDYTAPERGPPTSAYDDYPTCSAVDRGSHGASALPAGAVIRSATAYTTDLAYGYDTSAQSAQTDGTTERPSAAGGGDLSSLRPGEDAANTAGDAEQLDYRIHGGDARQWGHSWTTENPLEMASPRSRLGLPKVNSGEHLTCARVCNNGGSHQTRRAATRWNPGGGPEWLFPNPEQQLEHLWTIFMEPPI